MAEVIKINRPFVQEDSVDLGVIKINRPFSQEELGEKEPTTGFFGKVPLSKYKAGERNIVGNIFERPGAAIRSAIQGKGYVAGALNPTNVPKFQEQILETYYKKLPNFPGKTVLGNIPSALGMAADIVTEPTNLLTGLAPKIPLGAGRTLGQVISATKPAQALKTLGQTPIQDLKISKALMSEKGGVLPKIFNTPNTDSIIDTAINKAIKPSTGGKTTFAQVQNYSTKAREAVKSIYANKDNLVFDDPTHPFGYTNKLPETLNEFSSAVEQTKMKVFEQYDSLVQQAGRERVKISLNDISKELNLLAKNKVLNDVRPEIASYAKQQALRFTKRGNYSPQETQEAIKIYNQSLDAFYKNPNPETASKAVIDSGIVNNLRKTLDDSILSMPEQLPSETSSAGLTYQQLKNQYGALKTIEKDVSRRAMMDAKKNIKGLIDFTDVFSGGQMVRGILTLNPQEFAIGATQKMITNTYKMLNNPNNIIKGMFKHLDKINKTAQALTKRSVQ